MSKSRLIPEVVLDAEAAAAVLGVSRWLVLRLARAGKLPGKKVGNTWRFRLTSITHWAEEGLPTRLMG